MAQAPRVRGEDLVPDAPAPHLFLSHSSKDEDFVGELAQDLSACGVDVWLDTWELRVGTDLHERIAEAIDMSQYVAVVVSGHFSDSKWIRGEVHQALSREKAEDRTVVLPLLAAEIELPPVLSSKKALDFVGESYYPSLVRLAAAVHDLGPDRVEDGIRSVRPTSIAEAIDVLRYCGFNPFYVVGTRTLEEIEQSGGRRSGDRIYFDPRDIEDSSTASPALRNLMDRMRKVWRLPPRSK